MSKRIFDIVFAFIGVAVFFIPWVIIACSIKIDDMGAVFFLQQRLGKNRKPFFICKFRSMAEGKITRVGYWIRKTGIDESLQFINVLKGDMSMVGPRPFTESDLEKLGWTDLNLHWRWRVKPGITGFAQIYEPRATRKSLAKDRYDVLNTSRWREFRWVVLSFAMNILGKQSIRNILLKHQKGH